MARRQWFDLPDTTSPLSASLLNDLESRKVERDITSINVRDPEYGAVGDGVVDDTVALRAAITAAGSHKTVVFPDGDYLTDELDITGDGVFLYGPAATLMARSNSMNILHWSGSYGGVRLGTLDGNAHTGVSGLRITPQDESQTTTLVNQNYNVFDIRVIGSCAEAIVMKAGPRVTGADSGCWYNRFYSVQCYSCARGLWLKDAPTNPGSGVNRNQFYGFFVIGVGGSNTGIQIDDGETNTFYGCSLEGIAAGTSPNTTPTAIKIKATGGGGGDCNDNWFYGSTFEANTLDLENDNARSQFYGHTIGSTKRTGTQIPAVMVGSDASAQPIVLPGMRYPEGSLAGFDNNWNLLKDLIVQEGVAAETRIGAVGPSSQAGIKIGTDVAWYLHGSQTIRTPGVSVVDLNGYFQFGTANQVLLASAGVRFGSGADAGIERSANGSGSIATTGAVELPAVAAANVANNSVFRDTADDIIKVKDNGGTVRLLY